jgi:hypothetical protein
LKDGDFQYSVDIFCNYRSEFSNDKGIAMTISEENWYYDLFGKYVLPEKHWTMENLSQIAIWCSIVYGQKEFWKHRLETHALNGKYSVPCSFCLDMCRLLIPPNRISQPALADGIPTTRDVTGFELQPSKSRIPDDESLLVDSPLSFEYFSGVITKQSPLVNALFMPMGFKDSVMDGRPILCVSTTPRMNHRGQNVTKTKEILETIQSGIGGRARGYNIVDSYNFCPFILQFGEDDDPAHLVDYSEVDGPKLAGRPIALPLFDHSKQLALVAEASALLSLLKRPLPFGAPGGSSAASALNSSAESRLKQYEDLSDSEAIMPHGITRLFVLCKLELDAFFSEQLQTQEHSKKDFTSILHHLQLLLKINLGGTFPMFPHTPMRKTKAGDEELPLIFHQTRFLLQAQSRMRIGTLEGCHRMHAVVTSLTNLPFRGGLDERDFTHASSKPYPIRTELFFQRADCFDSTPDYQKERFSETVSFTKNRCASKSAHRYFADFGCDVPIFEPKQ